MTEHKPMEDRGDNQVMPEAERPGAKEPEDKPAGCILVVEDHAPLRELIAAVLADAGHRVLEAASGSEAIRLAQETPVDVLLTDVVMPGMNGPALVEQLRALSRHLQVVFMSGHDQEMLETSAQGALFLQKPFTPKTLTAMVSTALESLET